jgi:hypothetical protein
MRGEGPEFMRVTYMSFILCLLPTQKRRPRMTDRRKTVWLKKGVANLWQAGTHYDV